MFLCTATYMCVCVCMVCTLPVDDTYIMKLTIKGQTSHSCTTLTRLPDQLTIASQRITTHQHSLLVGMRNDVRHRYHVKWKERYFLHGGHVTVVTYRQQRWVTMKWWTRSNQMSKPTSRFGVPMAAILRIREDLTVPDFLAVVSDITDDPAYSPYSLSDIVL